MYKFLSPPLAAAALVLLTLYAFFPALEAGFITWDDPAMILGNPYFHDLSPQALLRLFTRPFMTVYQPLTVLSLALQYKITGLDPFFLHLGNLLLHLANVVLVFGLAGRLGMGVGTSLATAALFAVHPTRVDSVAWLTERKDVLFSFFYLLGLYLHLSLFDPVRARLRMPVFACFLLSLLSKPTAISFPFALALLGRLKWEYPVTDSLKLCRSIFVLVGIVALILLTGPSVEADRNAYHDTSHSGLLDRLARVWVATGTLITCLAVPTGIPLLIPYVPVGEWPPEALKWSLASSIFCILIYISRRHPLRLCALLFFPVSLLPVSAGIFFHGLGQFFTAVWHAYLPAFGVFLYAADVFREAVRRLRDRGQQGVAAAAIAAALLCTGWMVSETRARCGYYGDGVTFWNEVVRQTPHHIALTNRGMSHFMAGDTERARADFLAVTERRPEYDKGWIHLAAAELALGKPDAAALILEKALKKWPDEPMIHDYLGLIDAGASRTAEAIAHYSEALRLAPGYVAGLNNRAAAYRRLGEHGKAIADLDAALRLDPGNPQLKRNRDSISESLQPGHRQ